MHDTAELVSPKSHGFWETVKESLRGSQQDYTRGSIARAIMLLAVPMVLEMVLESVFAVTDVFFVGKLGANAIATVGLTESLLTVLYALAMGLSIGVTAMVARRIGEKDVDGARDAAVQGVLAGLIIATVLGVTGVILAPRLLGMMGASPEVVLTGSNFTRVMLGGDVSVLLLFLVNAIFRGAGDAAIAMRVLWLANAINIVLGPLLIFGVGPFPRLGVTGAAIATTIGRGTGAVFALSRLMRGKGRISIVPANIRVHLRVMKELVTLSAAGTLQMIIGMASWIGLVRIISTYGSQALAGYTIGVRLIIFAMLPSWGMSNAAATMVGQALGAKDPVRAESAVWRAVVYNTLFLTVVGLVFLFATAPIVGFFTRDPAVAGYAYDCLHTVSYGFILYASGMVLTSAFNGAGDTWTPTVLNLIIFWLFEIPLAYFLAQTMHMGPHGVFLAITVAFCAMAVVSALVFRLGRWKQQKV
ncbi:MAG: MATE family efflux transporter [Gemmatimonadota bacterium]|nr:MATE family efflux transporter [Gemmatimonadota bacterium]